MKKLASLAVVAGLVAIIVVSNFTVEAAKTNKKTTMTSQKTVSEVNNADGKVGKDDFAVVVNGVEIKLGEDLSTYLKELGKPDELTQARSCNYDGDDKVYTYGDVILYTYTNGKQDILCSVELIGETPTLSGIKVGSTKQEVIKAYGNEYTDDSMYLVYEYTENASIGFQMEKDVVTFIYIDASYE